MAVPSSSTFNHSSANQTSCGACSRSDSIDIKVRVLPFNPKSMISVVKLENLAPVFEDFQDQSQVLFSKAPTGWLGYGDRSGAASEISVCTGRSFSWDRIPALQSDVKSRVRSAGGAEFVGYAKLLDESLHCRDVDLNLDAVVGKSPHRTGERAFSSLSQHTSSASIHCWGMFLTVPGHAILGHTLMVIQFSPSTLWDFVVQSTSPASCIMSRKRRFGLQLTASERRCD